MLFLFHLMFFSCFVAILKLALKSHFALLAMSPIWSEPLSSTQTVKRASFANCDPIVKQQREKKPAFHRVYTLSSDAGTLSGDKSVRQVDCRDVLKLFLTAERKWISEFMMLGYEAWTGSARFASLWCVCGELETANFDIALLRWEI